MGDLQGVAWISRSFRVPEFFTGERESIFASDAGRLRNVGRLLRTRTSIDDAILHSFNSESFETIPLHLAVESLYGSVPDSSVVVNHPRHIGHQVALELPKSFSPTNRDDSGLLYFSLEAAPSSAKHRELDYSVRRRAPSHEFLPQPHPTARNVIDIAQIMAHRRWELYSSDFADRIYQVSLPQGTLYDKSGDFECTVLPIVTLQRQADSPSLRRFVNVTIIIIPSTTSMDAPDEVWRRLLEMENPLMTSVSRARSVFQLQGDAQSFLTQFELSSVHAETVEAPATMGSWLERFEYATMFSLLGSTHHRHAQEICSLHLRRSASVTPYKGQTLLCPEPDSDAIRSMLRYHDSLRHGVAPTRPKQDFDEVTQILSRLGVATMDVNDQIIRTSREDPGPELVLHFEDRSLLLGLSPTADEEFPNHSALILGTSLILMSLNLASLRSITNAFHHEVDRSSARRRLANLMTEFAVDLDDIYDLDLRIPGYRRAFDDVKERSGDERNFESVKWSMQVVTERMSDEDSHRTTLVSTFLTVTIAAATFAALTHELKWPSVITVAFAIASLVPALAAVWLIFLRPLLGRRRG